MSCRINIAYIFANEPTALYHSLSVMTQFEWVNKAIVLDTTKDFELKKIGPKIHLLGKNFGNGFDKQPEDGGLDEISARNFVMDLAREDSDWIIRLDADEVLSYEFVNLIHEAEKNNKNCVMVGIHSILGSNQIIYYDHPFPFGLHNPHYIAFKSDMKMRYAPNGNSELVKTFKNRTIHMSNAGIEDDKVLYSNKKYHLHLDMICPYKRWRLDHPLNKIVEEEVAVNWQTELYTNLHLNNETCQNDRY